jgi:glycosyltransferase involved in cell wall biosynthesis
MIYVNHYMDDTGLGGVSRGLVDRISRMSSDFHCEQCNVIPEQFALPPPRKDIGIIHFTTSWAKLPFLTMLRAQYGSRPLVIVEHSYTRSFEMIHVRSTARFRRMLQLSYRLADVVVAVSEGQAEWLVESGVVPRDKLVVIKSATDCSKLLTISPPTKHQGPMRLGAFGRYCEQKSFDTLIEAMRLVPPSVAKLVLAGYGPLEDELRSLAHGLTNVEIRGRISGNLDAFLSECDAIAIPSRYEAFGIVAVESKSAARPIIVTKVDGLTEQVDPSCGLIVSPEHPKELADAIMKMASLDHQKMGIAARLTVTKHFDDHLEKWSDLLRVLNRNYSIGRRSKVGRASAAMFGS